MSAKENKDVVSRVIASMTSDGPPEDLFSPTHTIYGAEGSTELGGPLPYSISVEDQIAEGDKVVTRWTLRIGSGGEDAGDSAVSNQVIVASGITIDRVSGGKIEETWTSWDLMDVTQEAAGAPEEFVASDEFVASARLSSPRMRWPRPHRP